MLLMRKLLIFILLSASILSSCEKLEIYKHHLKMIKVTELNSAKVSDSAIVRLLKEELNEDVSIRYTLSEDTALEMLAKGKVDLAIIPNNTKYHAADIRVIAPLLPRIFVVLTHNIPADTETDLKNLLENNSLIVEDLSRIDSIFLDKLFLSYNVDKHKVKGMRANSVKLEEWKDSSLVFIGLTHLHNPNMRILIDEGAHFFFLDDPSLLGYGSSVEGFIMDYPSGVPFILPKDFYKGRPAKPVLTVAIQDIMVTRGNVSGTLVYDIVKTLTEHRSRLIEMDNIYALLQTSKFSEEDFSFPLHKGALDYLERDQPSLLTRYASVLWPFLSMLAILAGALASVNRRMKMRKKLSIEKFYRKLLLFRKRAMKESNEKEKEKLLKEVQKLRTEAFDALMEDKLVPDNTFQIFLILYGEVMEELQS